MKFGLRLRRELDDLYIPEKDLSHIESIVSRRKDKEFFLETGALKNVIMGQDNLSAEINSGRFADYIYKMPLISDSKAAEKLLLGKPIEVTRQPELTAGREHAPSFSAKSHHEPGKPDSKIERGQANLGLRDSSGEIDV